MHTPVNAHRGTKTIPLKAVRDALLVATVQQKLRRVNGAVFKVRFAAFTHYAPFSNVRCRTRHCGVRKLQAHGMHHGMHHGCMDRGDIADVITRTHYTHGAAEVRRTWGAGMRALLAEVKGGWVA